MRLKIEKCVKGIYKKEKENVVTQINDYCTANTNRS